MVSGKVEAVELDAAGQAAFEEMCLAIDTATDGLDLMTRTQDMVALLLHRAADQPLREMTLGEVSHFFLGVMKAADLSDDYRMRRLKVFAKATVRLLISRRPRVGRAVAS